MDPAHIPGYDLIETLGHGGMGTVYLGRCPDGHPVAIKVLSKGEGVDLSSRRLRFQREIQILKSLTHPNIVSVTDHGSTPWVDYYVMEYVDGVSLREFLDGLRTPLNPDKCVPILRDITRALECLHQAGIVHRDLKPENILLGKNGDLKVTDFGISSLVEEIGLQTATGHFLGTLDYMAPEQRARLPLDGRADQYSMAVIAYEMLAGKRPLGRFKPPSHHNPRLGQQLDSVLLKGLEEDPDDRFGTVSELVDEISNANSRPKIRIGIKILSIATIALIGTIAVGVPVRRDLAKSNDLPINNYSEKNYIEDPTDSLPAKAKALPEEPTTEKERSKTDRGPTYFLDLARDHAAKLRTEDSIRAYTELVRLAPDEALPLVERADQFRQARLHDEALADLEKALSLDPTFPNARALRGMIYAQLGDSSRAIFDLTAELDQDPTNPAALTNRGWLYFKSGKSAEATADLNQSIAADPAFGLAYQYRALVSMRESRFAQAMEDFRQAIKCSPTNPYPHTLLSSLLSTCKNRDLRNGELARIHAMRACELTQEKNAQCLQALSAAYAELNQLDEAIETCQKALKVAHPAQKTVITRQLKGYEKRVARKEDFPDES